MLSQVYDTNANAAKFNSKFDGNIKHAIRFIFDIKRYEIIAQLNSPDTLFINIHNNDAAHIQPRFSQDEADTILKQINTLPDKATPGQIKAAAIHSTDSMQKFFMRHFRPTVRRGNIFRHLLSLRMR